MNNGQPDRAPTRGDLLHVLTALDVRDRAVVQQLHVLRRSPEQAAAELGLPVEEVHRRANRAAREICAGFRRLKARSAAAQVA
ncbi:hypothetical protein [Streptomyces sp. URMC 123]|uniref:hypothetical protein n=1 Tax=Streptomyces sp. URMC 123 TaxID=3423403 RepID=UPI003F1AB59C